MSTKVRRDVLEKAKKYGINVSEVLRKALEEEIRKREEEARRSAKEIAEVQIAFIGKSWQFKRPIKTF
ncbi:hypothetical protein SULI_13490 [Saccharolobus solfataricus]|uniref:VapB-type antitoxin n=1 Tax=Saccharolobus solfataricus TaxID=2287 RepID=A0A3G2LR17_SACSO|nr:hypothetical protein SULB_03835 [Saccharolobus solfataricus]AYN75814.1 hypothetical protein SULC_03820 [Saccharolobus solfataricus]AYP18650.1 hypothetical protein SULA_03825 [Saccharolobus solfataricus]AZF69581.1 hypothetical protein SULG_13490 [Saccharolobus solfataricus]AZF72201.1 hypothetical protein SULH_13490 [Saccharolobus solfataricus]